MPLHLIYARCQSIIPEHYETGCYRLPYPWFSSAVKMGFAYQFKYYRAPSKKVGNLASSQNLLRDYDSWTYYILANLAANPPLDLSFNNPSLHSL